MSEDQISVKDDVTGNTLEFPSGTDPSVIKATLNRQRLAVNQGRDLRELPGSTSRLRQDAGVSNPSLWDRATTGLLDPAAEKLGLGTEFTTRALSGRTAEQAREEAARPETPLLSRFALNAAPDASSNIQGLTSPVSIGTMGLGAAGSIPGAAGQVARAANVGVGAAFGAQGAQQMGGAREGETLPDTLQRNLSGASGVAGGVAAVTPGVKMAKGKFDSVRASMARKGHEAGIKELATAVKAENTDPFVSRAFQQVVEDAGGAKAVLGNGPEGITSRLLDAYESGTPKAIEYVQTFISRNPEAPISIAPVRLQVQEFLSGGFARNLPKLAATLENGLESGFIPAKAAYQLKTEMNKYYRTDIADATAYKPRDAMAVGDHLRNELGVKFGKEFSLADSLLGDALQGRSLLRSASDKASKQVVPGKLGRIAHEASAYLPAVGAVAGLTGGGVPGALGGAFAGRLAERGAQVLIHGSKTPLDTTIYKALKKMQFEPGTRPGMSTWNAANLRPPDPSKTVTGEPFAPWDELTQMETGTPPAPPPGAPQIVRPPAFPFKPSEPMVEGPPYAPEAPPPAVAGARGLPPAEGIGGMQLSQPAPVPPLATGAEQSAAALQQMNRGSQSMGLQRMQASNQAALNPTAPNFPPPINPGFLEVFEAMPYKDLRVAFGNMGEQRVNAIYEAIKAEKRFSRQASHMKSWLEDLNQKRGLGPKGEILP